MADVVKAISELADVVQHLVGTHVRWNVDMSHREAQAKVAAARLAIVAEEVAEVAQDVADGDVAKTVEDLTKALEDAKAKLAALEAVPVTETANG